MTTRTNQKTPTMDDVARALGVTKSTVSRALAGNAKISEETRRAVLQAAREMNFAPNPFAQRLSNNGGDNTVCLFSLHLDFGVGARKVRRVQSLLHERGFAVPIHCDDNLPIGHNNTRPSMISTLRRLRPRAIICNASEIRHERSELEHFRAEGGIVICYDFPVSLVCDRVLFDREDNTHRAAQHLIELGHSRIGLHFNRHSPYPQRLDGFTRALGEARIALREEWLFHGLGEEEEGVQLAQRWLELPAKSRPTGMCIINDMTAVAFITQLQKSGVRVPQDVSVVGHDDLPIGQFCSAVALTTASQPVEKIARGVVELLEERLQSPDGRARKIVVPGELIVRDSTAPPGR